MDKHIATRFGHADQQVKEDGELLGRDDEIAENIAGGDS
jgi:hypothetical protein